MLIVSSSVKRSGLFSQSINETCKDFYGIRPVRCWGVETLVEEREGGIEREHSLGEIRRKERERERERHRKVEMKRETEKERRRKTAKEIEREKKGDK